MAVLPSTIAAAENVAKVRSSGTGALVGSLVLLVGAMLAQRLVGFGRNLWFCAVLSEEELGRWSLAYNVLLVAPPLLVCGIPGSFGRYAGQHRARGTFWAFLRRTTLATGLLTCAGLAATLCLPELAAQIIFGDARYASLIPPLALTLLLVAAANALAELLPAVHLVRGLSAVQMVSGLGFAVASIALIHTTSWREGAVLLGYAAGCALAIGCGLLHLRDWSRTEPPDTASLSSRELWSKLLPFAGWLWIGNLVANLFETVDQFMLLHFAGLAADVADGQNGQYYFSRLVPTVMISVVCAAQTVLLPHLVRDWEAGRRELVQEQLNLAVKLAALLCLVGGAVALAACPPFFQLLFGDRYQAGFQVMPLTLAYSAWYCIGVIATLYLLCAERAQWSTCALLIGLVVNIGLNCWWAPRFGLTGVVWATLVANGVALAAEIGWSRQLGMGWSRGALAASCLPLLLLAGPGWAALTLAAGVAVEWRGATFFTSAERARMMLFCSGLRARLSRCGSSVSPE